MATRALEALATHGVAAVPTEPRDVLRGARPTDWIVLSGLSPADAVETADRLLAGGFRVALDTSETPALGRALARPWRGLECVLLTPRGRYSLEPLALRARDVLATAFALVVLAPLLALIAALVKRSSPGSVFFATTVVGRDGRTFIWRKFRSMRVGTTADDERRREMYRAFLTGASRPAGAAGSAKIIDETRVTPIGRTLRRHSLDELPQLWNVLRGEMTLVGPRPCLPYEYELQAPWHRRRFRVTPGLSGPWQVYGRSKVTVDEMALIDYCYGRARSFWLDLWIICRTVAVVVSGEGGK